VPELRLLLELHVRVGVAELHRLQGLHPLGELRPLAEEGVGVPVVPHHYRLE